MNKDQIYNLEILEQPGEHQHPLYRDATIIRKKISEARQILKISLSYIAPIQRLC